MTTINETLDKIMQLDIPSREMLMEILQKRQIEERRKEIVRNGKQSKAAYKAGKITPTSAANVVGLLNNF